MPKRGKTTLKRQTNVTEKKNQTNNVYKILCKNQLYLSLRLFAYLFVRLFVCSFVHLFVCFLVCLFVRQCLVLFLKIFEKDMDYGETFMKDNTFTQLTPKHTNFMEKMEKTRLHSGSEQPRSGRKYWATRSSICLFARTAHSFDHSALFALLMRSAALRCAHS